VLVPPVIVAIIPTAADDVVIPVNELAFINTFTLLSPVTPCKQNRTCHYYCIETQSIIQVNKKKNHVHVMQYQQKSTEMI
jgi:hypothetical protein